MKILCMADFHGRCPDISGLGFDAIIAAGDFMEFSKLRRIIFGAWDKGRKDWWNVVERRELAAIVEKVVESGKRVASYLSGFGKSVFSIPGNTDLCWRKDFEEISERYGDIVGSLEDIQGKVVDWNGIRIAGYGGTYDDEPKLGDDIKKRVEDIAEMLEREMEHGVDILVSHAPPRGTTLSLSPKGMDFGSGKVREWIERFSPVFSISGHVHEAMGEERIGKTTVINTGPAYDGNAVIIERDGDGWQHKRIKIGRVLKFY